MPRAGGPSPLTPDDLLGVFAQAAAAQLAALASLDGPQLRQRTDRPGQYALDLVADAAVLAVLTPTGVAIVSEESGRSGPADSPVTVVLDPVDGSTNCSRRIPYWAISLCAVDADGPWCALVANQATGERMTAVRGGGAWCNGEQLVPSAVRRIEQSLVALSGMPDVELPWKQFRALGSAALTLCDVAAGRIDAYLDAYDQLAPWDYLGGSLICAEAGAAVEDVHGRALVTTDPDARRQIRAAGTTELLEDIRIRTQR